MALDIKIIDNSPQVLRELSNRIEQALTAIGMAAETNAKKEVTRAVYDTPERGYVRTGNLRNRLTFQLLLEQQAVLVGERLEYAPYIELGSTRMRPRPFLKPAILNYADEYKQLAEQAFRG